MTRHVLHLQMNVLLDYLVPNRTKLFVLIILALIVFFNVKFLMNVSMEFYVQINLVDHLYLCVQNKSLV